MLRATHAAEVSQMRRARASLMIRFTSSRTKADSSLDWRSSFMQRQRSCSSSNSRSKAEDYCTVGALTVR